MIWRGCLTTTHRRLLGGRLDILCICCWGFLRLLGFILIRIWFRLRIMLCLLRRFIRKLILLWKFRLKGLIRTRGLKISLCYCSWELVSLIKFNRAYRIRWLNICMWLIVWLVSIRALSRMYRSIFWRFLFRMNWRISIRRCIISWRLLRGLKRIWMLVIRMGRTTRVINNNRWKRRIRLRIILRASLFSSRILIIIILIRVLIILW